MDSTEFRQRGREMVDYIAEYMESVGERRVTPDVEPGYLRDLIPKKAPHDGEGWADIMSDVETKIMPGVSETLFLICFRLSYSAFIGVDFIIVHAIIIAQMMQLEQQQLDRNQIMKNFHFVPCLLSFPFISFWPYRHY